MMDDHNNAVHQPGLSDDSPKTYASLLATIFSDLREAHTAEYNKATEADGAEVITEILEKYLDSEEISIDTTEHGIHYTYPSPNNALNSSLSNHISLTVHYRPDGSLKVDSRYQNRPKKNTARLFYKGFLEDFTPATAFDMGSQATIDLSSDYLSTGMGGMKAFDLTATLGVGVTKMSWANSRGVGIESVRKNLREAESVIAIQEWPRHIAERNKDVCRCGDCGRNMQTVDSCDEELVIVDKETGDTYERIRMGDERAITIQQLESNNEVDEDYIEEFKEISKDRFDRCPDCGIEPGKVHHNNCDREKCAKCHEQLLSCDCQIEIQNRHETHI